MNPSKPIRLTPLLVERVKSSGAKLFILRARGVQGADMGRAFVKAANRMQQLKARRGYLIARVSRGGSVTILRSQKEDQFGQGAS